MKLYGLPPSRRGGRLDRIVSRDGLDRLPRAEPGLRTQRMVNA